jgi:hypothetical protein
MKGGMMSKSREQNLKEFVERIDQMKKANPKDLSSDQDLSIGIMNLISIEEHLVFTGAKTEKTHYYDILPEIHAMRRGLLEKIIKHYEGEIWCTSKHLLAASMRLLEVGMKQMDMGNREEGYKLFDQSYELYCLFWGLNMNAINLGDIKWKELGVSEDEIRGHIANSPAAAKLAGSAPESVEPVGANGGIMSKLKDAVKKAVNCCIE